MNELIVYTTTKSYFYLHKKKKLQVPQGNSTFSYFIYEFHSYKNAWPDKMHHFFVLNNNIEFYSILVLHDH